MSAKRPKREIMKMCFGMEKKKGIRLTTFQPRALKADDNTVYNGFRFSLNSRFSVLDAHR